MLTHVQAAAQITTKNLPPGLTVNKWTVLEDITAARAGLGLPDRAIAVLRAMLSFHPEVAMTSGDGLTVFPSNEALAARAHGIAVSTLKRQIAVLLEAGIIVRRDSPNGKRYARKGDDGAIERAFGFDLTPIVARAEEFAARHREADRERVLLIRYREQVSLHRRDIAKGLQYLDRQVPAAETRAWRERADRLLAAAQEVRAAYHLAEIVAELAEISREIAKCLESNINGLKMGCNAAQNGPHIQNQNTDSLESEPGFRGSGGDAPSEANAVPPSPAPSFASKVPPTAGILHAVPPGPAADPPAAMHPSETLAAVTPGDPFAPTLGLVLKACPSIEQHARGGVIRDFAELRQVALLVRAYLGISPDAWRDALEAMGEPDALLTIVMIHEKGDTIRSPGGYLRQLSQKRREGSYPVGPMLMSLLNTQLRAKPTAA